MDNGKRLELNTVKALLPKGTRAMVTEELVDKLERFNEDPLLVDSFKENFLTYINVMKSGKYKIDDYLYAVKFVSHKLLGDSDINAYAKAFPERYERLIAEGLDRSQMGAYVTAYRKNKLVIQIMEQTLVPSHVLNAPMYQEALNVQYDLMMNARSEMVRMKAAESVLEHTKQPEVSKLDIKIGLDAEGKDRQDKLYNQMAEIAKNQQIMLQNGARLEDIQKLNIRTAEVIDAEVDDEEDDDDNEE